MIRAGVTSRIPLGRSPFASVAMEMVASKGLGEDTGRAGKSLVAQRESRTRSRVDVRRRDLDERLHWTLGSVVRLHPKSPSSGVTGIHLLVTSYLIGA